MSQEAVRRPGGLFHAGRIHAGRIARRADRLLGGARLRALIGGRLPAGRLHAGRIPGAARLRPGAIRSFEFPADYGQPSDGTEVAGHRTGTRGKEPLGFQITFFRTRGPRSR